MLVRVVILVFVFAGSVRADPVDRWIARQKQIRTLSADFEQTRILRALKNPLRTPGRVFFGGEGAVRWELGVPAKMIFLRADGKNLLIDPRKKRVREVDMDSARGQGLMKFPFAVSRADLEERFRIVSVQDEGRICRLELVPRGDDRISKFSVVLDTATGAMVSFEMTFRDGSRLGNMFSNVRINSPLPEGTFAFDLSGYTHADR